MVTFTPTNAGIRFGASAMAVPPSKFVVVDGFDKVSNKRSVSNSISGSMQVFTVPLASGVPSGGAPTTVVAPTCTTQAAGCLITRRARAALVREGGPVVTVGGEVVISP